VTTRPSTRPHPNGPVDRRPRYPILIAVLVGVLGMSACTSSGGQVAAPSSSSSAGAAQSGGTQVDEQTAFENVIQKVLGSVVEIQSSTGLGSGVVYDSNGNIVTNAHVVGTEKQFQVLTSGSAGPLQASLVGSYPPNDLAVIKVSGGQLPPAATFADSDQAKVGELVLAMGNPLGLSATVTNGIVSATGRTVTEPATSDSPGATLPDMLQTSAPINPGNSGGALVDLQAQVLGIPTLAAVNAQEGGAAPGIGFAIPANQVRRIADQLVQNGTVSNSGRAALGVQVTTVVDQNGQPQGAAVIAVTPGGPADTAGIRPGDIIAAIDDKQITTAQTLGTVLAGLQPGQQVRVTLKRGGAQQQVQVTLGQL
jgi:S1-C subfamily serine protease